MSINSKDLKFLILFTIFWILFAVSYFAINYYLDQKSFEKSFENYVYYDISDNISDISNIKKELMNDQYFVNSVIFSEYNGSLNTQNSKELLRYYLSSLTNTNTRVLDIDEDFTKMCISSRYFYLSLYELFGLRSSDYSEVLNYTNFISVYKNKVCFYLSALEGLDRVNYVGVKSIETNDGIITADIYFYSIYIEKDEEETAIINLLSNSIERDKLEEFNDLFIDEYNGTVEEKTVKFTELPDGKFFKYSLISIETLKVIEEK